MIEYKIEYKLEDVFNETVENVKGPLIYRILNKENNKSYIGLASDSLLNRFCWNDWVKQSHRTAYINNYHIHLYNSMNLHGLDKFVVQIIYIGPDASSKEEYYVNKFDSFHNGYNRSSNGKGGVSCRTLKYINVKNLYTGDIIKIESSELDKYTKLGYVKYYGFGILWRNQEFRDKAIERSREWMTRLNSDPGFKEKLRIRASERMKRLHKNPEFAKGHSNRVSKRLSNWLNNNKDYNASRCSELGKRIWSIPGFRDKFIERRLKLNHDKEFQKKCQFNKLRSGCRKRLVKVRDTYGYIAGEEFNKTLLPYCTKMNYEDMFKLFPDLINEVLTETRF